MRGMRIGYAEVEDCAIDSDLQKDAKELECLPAHGVVGEEGEDLERCESE